MRSIGYYIFFIFITGTSFAQTKVNTTNKVVGKNETSTKKYVVKGAVMKVGSYCGGAAPSQEMMEEARKPLPYAGKIFYLRKGNVNTTKQAAFLSFKTDSLGRFNLKLEPGVYSIIQEAQVKELNLKDYQKSEVLKEDIDCLKKWWKKPYHVLEVKNKNIELNFSFNHPCFIPNDMPCIQYLGPLPP